MSLETSVFLTEECIITGNSEELIRITEYLTLQTRCRINCCRYNRVLLYKFQFSEEIVVYIYHKLCYYFFSYHMDSYIIVIITGKTCSSEIQITIINVGKSQQYNEPKINFTSPQQQEKVNVWLSSSKQASLALSNDVRSSAFALCDVSSCLGYRPLKRHFEQGYDFCYLKRRGILY